MKIPESKRPKQRLSGGYELMHDGEYVGLYNGDLVCREKASDRARLIKRFVEESDLHESDIDKGLQYLDEAISAVMGRLESEWPAPLPLPTLLPPVPAMAADMLPVGLRAWVYDIAERMQTPLAFGAVSAMVAVAAVVGRKVCVFPKQRDDWYEVPNLWGLLVGRPGIMKSPVMAEIMRPLDRLIAQAQEEHRQAMDEFGIFATAEQAKIAAVERQLKEAATKSDTAANEALLHSLATKLTELKNGMPAQPRERRYRTNDATVEKLQDLLAQNDNGLLVYRDEIAGLLLAMLKPGREGDRQFFLEAWKGDGAFVVDRIGRGTVQAKGLCLSLLGSIQPGRLLSYIGEALSGGIADDGMIQRFQLAVWPDPSENWENIDRWPDSESKEQAWQVFRRLADLQKDHLQTPANSPFDQDGIPGIRFEPAAQAVFNQWRTALEHRLRSKTLHPAMESHLAKYRGLMPSLALLFHLIDHAQRVELTTGCITPISKAAANLSVRWCAFLEAHAQRLYSADMDKASHVARALGEHIRNGKVVDGGTVRSICRHHWSMLDSTENVHLALSTLASLHWLRLEEVRSQGRPSDIVRLNPQLAKALADGEGDAFGTFGFWHSDAYALKDGNRQPERHREGVKSAKCLDEEDIHGSEKDVDTEVPNAKSAKSLPASALSGLHDTEDANSMRHMDTIEGSAECDDDIDLMIGQTSYARPATSAQQEDLPLPHTNFSGDQCPNCDGANIENGVADWRCRDCGTQW
jgi:putative DNA primase/helicase